jgi:hypothetical protein
LESAQPQPVRPVPETGRATFWVVSTFLFLWGVAYAGLVIFTFALSGPEHWQSLVAQGRIKPEYAVYIANIPAWAMLLTCLAAASRFAGGLGLMLRKSWAVPAYGASLVLVAVLMFRGFVLADVASVIRTSQIWLEAAFMALSIFAVWWARRHRHSGRLR